MNSIICEEDIKLNNGIKFLYFYALWMPFNKKMTRMISNLEQKYNNIEFLAINTDNFKNLCIKFNIKSIPTILIYNEGIEKHRVNGLVMSSALKNILNNI